jgi:hypothetical protein
MLKLRCYLFSKLAHEQRDRDLSEDEVGFLERHRLDCEECAARERILNASLDTLALLAPIEASTPESNRDILEKLDRPVRQSTFSWITSPLADHRL